MMTATDGEGQTHLKVRALDVVTAAKLLKE